MNIEAYQQELDQAIDQIRKSYFTDEELEKYLLWRKFKNVLDMEDRISRAIFEKYINQEN